MMKTWAVTAALLSALLYTAAPASAGHETPLECAATDYRDVVCDLRRDVHRLRYIERYDRRLVDDLERSANHFRAAAHHSDDIRRLLYHWNDLQALHGRVEGALFGQDCYPPNPALRHHWQRVQFAMGHLTVELRSLRSHSHGRHRSYHRPLSHVPLGHLPPVTHRDRHRLSSGYVSPPSYPSHPSSRAGWHTNRQSLSGRDAALAIVGGVLSRMLD